MRVVIPYTNDGQNGFELRYAIRSIVRHFKPLSGIVLIGDKPNWFHGEHIPAKDISGRKAFSIYSKILLSPYEDFIFSNDDIFATQHFDTLPLYYTGTLKEAKAHGKHLGRFEVTRKLLPDGFSYDIHTPMPINKTKFIEACNVNWSIEYLYRSLYGNYIGGGVQLADNKIRQGRTIPEGPFFSTNERTAKLINLPELYPIKSDYEI